MITRAVSLAPFVEVIIGVVSRQDEASQLEIMKISIIQFHLFLRKNGCTIPFYNIFAILIQNFDMSVPIATHIKLADSIDHYVTVLNNQSINQLINQFINYVLDQH